MDVVTADRIQFAFTIMFHYLFPIGTMGLAPFVAWYTWRGGRGDAQSAASAAFWTKIFAVNFAAGVVTGIPMEFQFGTNWAAFSAKAGAVIGQPLAMEGIYAFFLESVFLGVLLYGRERVSRGLVTLSAILVCLGSWLSGYFIVVTDAWMQHPVGYAIGADGRIEMTSLAAVLLSPFALWQFAHVPVRRARRGRLHRGRRGRVLSPRRARSGVRTGVRSQRRHRRGDLLGLDDLSDR